MVLEKDKLKEIIKSKNIKTSDDLNNFIKELVSDFTHAIYDAEIDSHLASEQINDQSVKNYRNGYGKKTVQSTNGPIELNPPRDRNGTFEPQLIRKRQTDITGMESKIITLFGSGMSTRDISDNIKDLYGYEVSAQMVSDITDSVIEKAKEWQRRPLKPVYSIIYMDAIVVKQKTSNIVKNTAIYGIIGIDMDGNKECLGLYITSEAETSKFWYSVLNEIKNRGTKTVLIFSVDNLNGISESIKSVYPNAHIQKCIVHQIRNSVKHVSYKEVKEVCNDLKSIYKAVNEQEGFENLAKFAYKWDKKYPYISKSWYNNWDELSTFFKYSEEIRTLIYTTNPIESFNRGLRKVSKNKCIFPTDDSILKLFYLAVEKIEKKWTQKIRNWGAIYSQLLIIHDEILKENCK